MADPIADLELRVQRLEVMRETEKAALIDAFRQIDELKQRIDWQYMKILHLEEAEDLRAARRPKPPSLKEQALELLPEIKSEDVLHLCPLQVAKIRRALEALPE